MSDTTITPEEIVRLRGEVAKAELCCLPRVPGLSPTKITDLLDALEQTEARAEKAEDENVRLTKMVDWLAGLDFDRPCAYACCPFDKYRPTGPDDDDCDKTHIQCWAEAARRAVAAGEGE